MAAEVADFPRGGIRGTSEKFYQQNEKEDIELFETEYSPSKKPKKRKAEPGKGNENMKKRRIEALDVKPIADEIEPMSSKLLSSGMLVLGCIKDIHDYELIIGLPGGLRGNVPITNISDAYTHQLQKLAASQNLTEAEEQDVHSLHELFKVGMVLPCKVMSIANKQKGRQKIVLSINPKDVNQELISTKLKADMVLSGCVSSCEDHGYVVELGIQGIRGFLPNGEAERFIQICNDGNNLMIGQSVCCSLHLDNTMGVKTGEIRVIQVTINPAKIQTSQVKEASLAFNCMVPGMQVTAKIVKKSLEGLSVKFSSHYGSIHKTQMPQKPVKYPKEEKIKACILYINPTTKAVALSLLPNLTNYNGTAMKDQFGNIFIGETVEKAKVVSVDKKLGVFFQLRDNIMGYANMAHLSDKPIQNLKQHFPKGSTHRCRILYFDPMEDRVGVSLKESTLREQCLLKKDIKPGMIVECTVKDVSDSGVSVRLTRAVSGFIQNSHLADVPVKDPAKKFKEGEKLTCRVWNFHMDKLKLTSKRTLVTSKLPIITSYDDVEVGKELDGVITEIKHNGVVVSFYGNIKGWVNIGNLSTESNILPEKMFYLGQVVRCWAVSCSPDDRKLKLTFLAGGEVAPRKRDAPGDFEIGKIFQCKVHSKKKKGLVVELMSSGNLAYLPMPHLSDFEEMCQLVMDTSKEGDVFDKVMYFCDKSGGMVTRKKSFLDAAKKETLVKDFSDIEVDQVLPGVVIKLESFGLFVELIGGLKCLIPSKLATDRRVMDLTMYYTPGQSVIVKVTKIDKEKERFLGSLRMQDCFSGGAKVSTRLLRSYLCERSSWFSKMTKGVKSKLTKLTVGSIVTASITNVTAKGVLCELTNGLRGFATKDHLEGKTVHAGDSVEAVVVFVDLLSECVELVLDAHIIRAVKHRTDNPGSQVKVEQSLKAEVLLIKPDFVLVALMGHGAGQVAYIPAKMHPNDVFGPQQFSTDELRKVIIQGKLDGIPLAVLEENTQAPGKFVRPSKQHDANLSHDEQASAQHIMLGLKVDARVTEVHDFHLTININGMPGRVHVTEMVENIKNGQRPLTDCQWKNQIIKVKVIGYWDAESESHVPVAHCRWNQTCLDCTIKPSKLKKRSGKKRNRSRMSLRVGDKVIAFVKEFTHNQLWMFVTTEIQGFVCEMNLSNQVSVLDEAHKIFKPGAGFNMTVLKRLKKKHKLVELSFTGHKEVVTEGLVTKGKITKVAPAGLDMQLANPFSGHVAVTDIFDIYQDRICEIFHPGEFLKCFVLTGSKKSKKHYSLSCRKSRLKPSKAIIQDPEIDDVNQLNEGQILRGYVTEVSSNGVCVSIGRQISGMALYSNMPSHFVTEDPQSFFFLGKLVTVKILQLSDNDILLSLQETKCDVSPSVPPECSKKPGKDLKKGKKATKKKRNESEKEKKCDILTNVSPKTIGGPVKVLEKGKKAKKRKCNESEKEKASRAKKQKKDKIEKKHELKETKAITAVEDTDSGVDINKGSESEEEKKADSYKLPTQDVPRLNISAGFSWDDAFTVPSAGQVESSDDESGDQQNTRIKTTKDDIRRKKQEEERQLFAYEKQQLEGEQLPQTADDFDRLVLQSPDSSLVWLRYMAFHLETAEIEKARAVAERALKTISFRDEQERLNVWVAYLNLENMYGTKNLLQKVFEKALKQNEPITVYQQMANIYVKTGKIGEAENLYSIMVKKFQRNRDVWLGFGLFLFKNNRLEAARSLLQRGLKSLEKKDHVETIAKFAQMEFKHGEPERGRTIFETVLSDHPKRTDLWSVYVDMVVKIRDVGARQLLERVVHMKFPAKKMKFFFKKYLDFEKKHGNDSTVENVKKKAMEYVESRGYVDD